jgi:hypothetical protein
MRRLRESGQGRAGELRMRRRRGRRRGRGVGEGAAKQAAAREGFGRGGCFGTRKTGSPGVVGKRTGSFLQDDGRIT